MFTLTLSHSRNINRFFKEGTPESAIIVDAQSEAARMSPESMRKAQEFAQRVIEAFETNSEARNAFLNSIDGVKQDIFKSPDMFQAFVDRAYEKHADALTKLEGAARTQKIKEFSVFIRDVMLQFADMNTMKDFARAIEERTKALEEKYGIIRSQTSQSMKALQAEITQA